MISLVGNLSLSLAVLVAALAVVMSLGSVRLEMNGLLRTALAARRIFRAPDRQFIGADGSVAHERFLNPVRCSLHRTSAADRIQAGRVLGRPGWKPAAVGVVAGGDVRDVSRQPPARSRPGSRRDCRHARGRPRLFRAADAAGGQSVYTERSDSLRWRRAQSHASGSEHDRASADPLSRLCRLHHSLCDAHRRAGGQTHGQSVDPEHTTLGHRRLALSLDRHPARREMGVCCAGMGRLLGMGPGRKCLAPALAHGNRACFIRSWCNSTGACSNSGARR